MKELELNLDIARKQQDEGADFFKFISGLRSLQLLPVSGKVLRQLNDWSFTLVVFVPLNDLIFLMKRARKAQRCDSIRPETINH